MGDWTTTAGMEKCQYSPHTQTGEAAKTRKPKTHITDLVRGKANGTRYSDETYQIHGAREPLATRNGGLQAGAKHTGRDAQT